MDFTEHRGIFGATINQSVIIASCKMNNKNTFPFLTQQYHDVVILQVSKDLNENMY